jgi:hypothetical protein
VAQHDDLKLPLTATADKHANEDAQEPVEQRHQHEAQSEPAPTRSPVDPVSGRIDFLYPTGRSCAVARGAGRDLAYKPCGPVWIEDPIPPTHYGVESLGNPNDCYGVALTIEVRATRATKRAIIRCPFGTG